MKRPQHDVLPGRFAWLRRFGRTFSPVGLAFALLFFCASMTPSLIPRTWLVQAMISGVCVSAGYVVGTLIGWIARKLGRHPQWTKRTQRIGWWVLAGFAVVAIPTFQLLGSWWQTSLREIFGMDDHPADNFLLVIFFSAALALLLLAIFRGLRGVARWLGRLLGRWIPREVATLSAALVTVVVAILLINGTVFSGMMSVLDSVYSSLDKTTEDGVVQPTAPERSGSPESDSPWESLGLQGRTFVAGGPTASELAEFASSADGATQVTASEVKTPIRVYAGLDVASGTDAVAQRVVNELDRTNAWDRKILVVVTTTGTGWVDPSAADTLEFMYGGDSAIAAMQYSYLPSWISFISGREIPPNAGKALFEAVYAKWSTLPEATRPKLVVFGESLGSYGGQGAFSGLQDLSTRTDGALWIGTPNFTENWTTLTNERDPGSLQRDPVYQDGRQVRWGVGNGSAADVWDLGPTWESPRVVYVQHGSDAVTWWSPDLFLHEPDWLREPAAPDVLGSFHWIPIVTFWQVSFDLLVAADVPPGYGHNYHLEYTDGWTAVASPQGWTDADTERLRETMAARPSVS